MNTWLIRHSRAVLVIFLGGALSACQSTTRPVASEMTSVAAVASPAPTAAQPEVSGPAAVTTSSGLQVIEVAAGTGPAPQAGDVVAVHYTGMLADGTVFDSSRQRNEPIEFPLGQGAVIAGWDEGIAMMREGGKARLIIPPQLAYGAEGAGGVIPPNATLTFDVELVQVR